MQVACGSRPAKDPTYARKCPVARDLGPWLRPSGSAQPPLSGYVSRRLGDGRRTPDPK